TRGFLSNNVANSSVDLVLLDGPKPLTWTAAANNRWDIETSINWLAFGLTPIAFLNADSVRFDDSGAATEINLTTAVAPGAIIVSNATKTITLGGNGSVTGIGGLQKDGAGTLV